MADAAAARIEAVRLAGALLEHRPQILWESAYWRLLVTDENRSILFTIEVRTIMGAPSTALSARESFV